MQVIVPNKSAPLAHPIELMEKFVAANEWRLHHASATEISVEIPGQWSDYTLNLTWQGKHAALHLNVFLDIFILDSQINAEAIYTWHRGDFFFYIHPVNHKDRPD